MNNVAQNIKKNRIILEMTQEELAEKMNVTRQTISNWEIGKSEPDIETLTCLAELFNVEVADLIDGKKEIHQKHEKRYIVASIVFAAIILATLIIRGYMLSYFNALRNKFIVSLLGTVFVPSFTECVMFAMSGCLLVSLFSLWFNMSATNTKWLRIIGIVLLIPAFLVWMECLLQRIFSLNIILITGVALHRWLWVLIFWFLPFVAGILLGMRNR